MARGVSISRFSILSCAAGLCVGGAKAQAGDYTACGTLSQPLLQCKLFIPDNGQFPNGLLVGSFGNFAAGDQVRVTGRLDLDCGSVCQMEDGCLQENTIEICTVPAVSDWGLVVLALVTLIAGTIVIRRRGHKMLSATVHR